MKFFYDLMCPPSRAVLIFCNVLKAPIQEVQVALRKNEHLTEEFKRNVGKLQRLPILHDDGFILAESVAIFRYLTKKIDTGSWYPIDVKKRAQVDEYLSWTHNNIRVAIGMYIYARWRDPIITGRAADGETVRFLEKRLDNALNEMNDIWLATGQYLTGDSPTVADIFGVADLEQIKLTDKDAFQGRDRLAAWYKRVVPLLEPHFTEHHRFVHSRGKSQ